MEDVKIIFLRPNEKDIPLLYESYRQDGEPDSPFVPWNELDQAAKQIVSQGYAAYLYVVECDQKSVGWISVVDRAGEPEINIGFAIFKEFRGNSLMTKILQAAIETVVDTSGSKKVTAGARIENVAAIRSLERAGFKQLGTIERPPIREWKSPIVYTRHVYKG